jgi:3-hydroxyisobutyrate dehydrogenase-like beta-hydroxyacid dehydrogenase
MPKKRPSRSAGFSRDCAAALGVRRGIELPPLVQPTILFKARSKSRRGTSLRRAVPILTAYAATGAKAISLQSLKDVRLICELADSLGFQSPTLDNCRAQWEKFVHEEGHGDVDHSGLFLLYDKR